ncbi:LOW QUALITY PROTEIN: non-functional NADPH-dependent codeinone reductase 2-like [Pistacia vera]|uniref:LOW QUALITY PROTEIN: non-functional NADPH-dependent codeinone reductase 2-like n=1 Tax=Pistacia vera TaxID=55513 RepID=UPI00126301EB|nr:LOW QUALITY PROTEIN: non-functional NADPH-dependent codeinone reductase 2-like [Pistacia vera]
MVTAPLASLASNGETIPLVGLGTAEFPFNSTRDTAKQAALHAIQLGYRHFDTAALYGTEQALGEAIVEALRLGLIKSRDELFITSKLWASNAHRDLVLPAIKNTLKNLGLDYLDLYLVHFPFRLTPNTGFPFEKKEILPIDLKSVWEAMEECQKLGLTKSIGVGNFSVKKLEKLLATAKIPPAVDQVEMNPVWQQKKLREFCKKKGIHVTAYSPLGAKGTPWGTDRVLDSEVLKEIASSRRKSAAQVSLRWVHEQGVSLVVKSFDEGRMKENLDIFDWSLSEEELHKIAHIPQVRGNPADFAVSEEGPYKSIEEFWDGEI